MIKKIAAAATAGTIAWAGISGIDNTTRDEVGQIVQSGDLGAFVTKVGDCINDLPQDQNVTVKTVIRDTLTNTETVISSPVVATVASTAPAPTPARSAATDRATIATPSVSSRVVDASGALSVAIAMPAVPNFDSSKSWATLMVVDNKTGSTTAIGTDGTAQTLNVGSLGTGRDYTVSVVVRDLATGQETVIKGEGISK